MPVPQISLSDRTRRLLAWGSAAVLVLAGAVALIRWWPVLMMEASGALESDAHLYFAVGRSLLNGVDLWSGLFESKPPGMFQLAALSLLITGDETFALLLQVAIYIGIPALLAATAWIEAGRHDQATPVRTALATAGVVFGLLLSFFLEDRAGGFQTESVGSFFACLYLFFVASGRDDPSRLRQLGLGALIFLTLWMKEPFVFSIVAGSLLIARGWRHWIATLVIPGLLAGCMEIVGLLLIGGLGDYFNIYLPSMIQTRVGTDRIDPLYLRGLTVGRVYGNVTLYYAAPAFGYILALLWALFPAFKREGGRVWWDVPLAAATSLVAYHVLWYGFFPLARFNAWHLYGAVVDESGFPSGIAALSWLIPLLIVLLVIAWYRRTFAAVLAGAGMLFLVSTVVGISVYAVNHFAFAVPAYFALGLAFLRYAAVRPFTVPTALVLLMLAWGGFTYAVAPRQMEILAERAKRTSNSQAAYVTPVDGLLDACGWELYGTVDTYNRLSFARHSSYGPLIVTHFFTYLGPDHPLVLETFRRLRDEAPVIVSGLGDDHNKFLPALAPLFTETPPDCAKPFLPIPDMKVYFRIPTTVPAAE